MPSILSCKRKNGGRAVVDRQAKIVRVNPTDELLRGIRADVENLEKKVNDSDRMIEAKFRACRKDLEALRADIVNAFKMIGA